MSVDGDGRARVRSRKPAAEQAFREERTTVVLEVDVDALMKGDGVRMDVPLHVRYHPPLQDGSGGEALPSITGPLGGCSRTSSPKLPSDSFTTQGSYSTCSDIKLPHQHQNAAPKIA